MSDRPTVLFIHGLLSGRSVWARVVRELGDEVRCVTVDLPGHGRTPVPKGTYDLEALIDWLCDVVNRERPTHVVGHSMGGIVALGLAGRELSGVKGVGVVALPVFDSPETGREQLVPRGPLIRTLARWHSASHLGCVIASRTHGIWRRWAKRRWPYQPRSIQRAIFDHRLEAHRDALDRIIWAGLVDDLAARNELPVAALHGGTDRAAPLPQLQAVAERWGWNLSADEAATHQVLVERPRFTADWIREDVLHLGSMEGLSRSDGVPAGGD